MRCADKKEDGCFLLISLMCYACNQYLIKPNTVIPFFHCCANDLLAGMLFVSYVNLLLIYSKYSYRIKEHPLHCLLLIFLIGCIWEMDLGFLGIHNTSDPMDILWYLIGALINLGITTWMHQGKKHVLK